MALQYSNRASEVVYGTEHSPEAYSFWTSHDSFLQPWKHLESAELKRCDNADALYAPDNVRRIRN